MIEIYCDGSCWPNPGKGGWGAVLKFNGKTKELCGPGIGTETNNTMELKAAIESLKTLKTAEHPITMYTDSNYVVQGMNTWHKNWIKKDFHGVKNPDLWKELIAVSAPYRITWKWVKGHADNVDNVRADELANIGRKNA